MCLGIIPLALILYPLNRGRSPRLAETLTTVCYHQVEQLNWTTAMALVAVKKKYQVVIPQKVRERINLNVGDLLEARIERGKITFTPKSLVDRGIAEGLQDIRKGRVHGPYRSVAEAMKAFRDRRAGTPRRRKPAA